MIMRNADFQPLPETHQSDRSQSLVGTFAGFQVHVDSDFEKHMDEWRELEAHANDPGSVYGWCVAWYRAHTSDPHLEPVIIVGTDASGRPGFLIPLERRKIGLLNALVTPGADHTPYCAGLFSPRARQAFDRDTLKRMLNRVAAALGGIDVLIMDGFSDMEISADHPFRHLQRIPSDHLSFRFALSNDFEALYRAKANSKKRNDFRRWERRLRELGDIQVRSAQSRQEHWRLICAVLQQKTEQLASMQVDNPFAKANIRAFYHQLIDSHLFGDDCHPHLTALLLDGEPIACNFGIVVGSTYFGLILSRAPGPHNRCGPGNLLVYETFKSLCEAQLQTCDLGTGGGRHKDIWSDQAVQRYCVLEPFNLKGMAFVAARKMRAGARARIKRSDKLMAAVNRYRRYRRRPE